MKQTGRNGDGSHSTGHDTPDEHTTGKHTTGEHDTRHATGIGEKKDRDQDAVVADMSYLLGTIVSDRYEIHRQVGAGGMGVVFEAEHVHMQKRVALKVLYPRMMVNKEVVARFEREAVAAGRLQHPGIVGATDFGRLEDGSLFLVLEYVDGCSLAELMAQHGALPPERALGMAVQITSALCAAHAAGIVHRDLKPDNIMLVRTEDDEDFVKVLDFGIAKMHVDEDQKEGITRAGLVFGTPEYMSPEQAMGHEADVRSDLYGVGMVLYEMCQGYSPFRRTDVTAMLTAQITEPPAPLPDTVPERLARLIYCLLEKAPEDRLDSADELAEDLMIVAERMAWALPAPRTSAGTRLDVIGALGTGRFPKRRLGQALSSARSFSLQPVSMGIVKVPRWIPLVALVGGAALGVALMLGTREPAEKTPGQAARQEQKPIPSAEEQLLSDARSGDRDAIAELRKIATRDAEASGSKGPQNNQVALDRAARFMALGRGYSVIKHGPAAIEMYEQAVLLDPHLAEDPELLVDVRTALGAHDAVEDGLEFALEHLGSHGADLIYDVYLDHLGQAGMTPVVARAMRLVQGDELFEKASPALQVALRLARAKVCAEYRQILPDAASHADDRSLLKLRALTTRRGCGTYGNKDCFVCLRHPEVPLERAVERAETHPSPIFLTPAEAAREEGDSP